MTPRKEIVKTALLGTNRAALPTFPPKTDLDQLLNQIASQDAPATLLAIAGTMALHQQTGWQPKQSQPPGPVPPQPEGPFFPIEIVRELEQLLEGSQASLLPEMLEALAQTNHHIPDLLLPSLLAKGEKSAKLRPYLFPLLGPKGRWLASQNPEWRYASLEIESWAGLVDQWQTAVSSKRYVLLRQLRLTQPERGRQILEHTWKSNNDDSRHQLIKILDSNLSLTDEPFLEAALDDRNHLVRRTAADLLAKLPQSRLSQRMSQHVAGLLTWTPTKNQAIAIHLPITITPAMLRDGIPNVKEEEWTKTASRFLTQTISRVPLTHWQQQWQTTPQQIVQAALNSTWPRSLITAFSTAAVRQNDEIWARALIVANQFNTSTGRLVPLLSTASCFELMQQAAQYSTELQRPQPLYLFLQHWPQPWTVEMGHFWLDLFAKHLQQEKSDDTNPTLNNLFKRFGQTCPPELADTAVAQLTTIPNLSKSWQTTVQNLCQTLQLRHNLLAEIHSLGLQPHRRI